MYRYTRGPRDRRHIGIGIALVQCDDKTLKLSAITWEARHLCHDVKGKSAAVMPIANHSDMTDPSVCVAPNEP
jgi:hypothetical protein